MLDRVLETMLLWATSGKSKYKAKQFSHYMPADWIDETRLLQRKKVSLADQLKLLAKVYSRR